MPVIGLSLAIIPVLAVLAARALFKLLFLPFQLVRIVVRGRSALTLALASGLCLSGALAWTEYGVTDSAPRLVATR
ncbi:hypothetical protein U8607_02620 [Methylobacterium durans]|uniref:hypothetical protein n=1 Tax=Methylobacterium durans TaxID=2202825 RepID=UPI002AFEEC00|nr:hypothetical protein [Methylobacterium durans]MEA1830963.1 hypothetical protein [Methylobacterium durans]